MYLFAKVIVSIFSFLFPIICARQSVISIKPFGWLWSVLLTGDCGPGWALTQQEETDPEATHLWERKYIMGKQNLL